MGVKTYNPGDVTIIFAGITIEGYADGTFVNIGRDNDSWSNTTGADGEGARSKSNDRSGTCTLTLMQTSASNDGLSSQAAVDELTSEGVSTLMVKDGSGRTVYTAETAWITKPAASEFGKEISNREWIIKTDDLDVHVGGN